MPASDVVPIYSDLAGKVAVVTGGSGDRRDHLPAAAANGARVAVNGRDPTRIQAVVDAIGDLGG